MKSGLSGAFIGLVAGLVIGTALFGPPGGAVGVILGPVFGFSIMMSLAMSSVSEAAGHPHVVNCPETHEEVEVTLDPKQATRAELWNRRKRIATCSRFDGPPNCDEECLDQVDV